MVALAGYRGHMTSSPGSTRTTERRAHARRPLALEARLLLADSAHPARTVDVSPAAVLIEGGPFPPATMIDIEITMPGGDPVRLHGQVTRRAPHGDGERLAAVVARGAFDSGGPMLEQLIARAAPAATR